MVEEEVARKRRNSNEAVTSQDEAHEVTSGRRRASPVQGQSPHNINPFLQQSP